MNEFELELELDRIDLSYDTKINAYVNQLRELAVRDADLRMQLEANEKLRLEFGATITELQLMRDKEVLELKTKYNNQK